MSSAGTIDSIAHNDLLYFPTVCKSINPLSAIPTKFTSPKFNQTVDSP